MDGEVSMVYRPIPHQLVWSVGGSSNPLTDLIRVIMAFHSQMGIHVPLDTVTVGNTVGMDRNFTFYFVLNQLMD